MSAAVRILRDAPLRQRNTFGVAAYAPLLAEVADPAALPELLARPGFRGRPLLLLGGGSNLLFVGDVEHPVIALSRREVTVVTQAGGGSDATIVRADAGVSWHELAHLHAVGADVLDRRCANRPGD